MATVTSPSGHRLRSGLSAAGPPWAAVAAVDADADISIDVRAIRISSRVDVDDARPADAPAASSDLSR
jgi:hypothetical protein